MNVNGDTTLEDYEYFSVSLSNPTNAILGNAQEQVEIQNDEKPTMTVNNVSVAEGGIAKFAVTLAQRYYQTALYAAYQIFGRSIEGLLDHYRWATEFLQRNNLTAPLS